MQSDRAARLLLFATPGIEGWSFALPSGYVVAVASLDQVRRIPLTPLHVPGIARYRHRLIVLIDLAARLGIHTATMDQPALPQVIVHLMSGDYVAWKVAQVRTITAPVAAPIVQHPFPASLVETAFLFEGAPVLLLNPDMLLA